jgi:hypothetical protein
MKTRSDLRQWLDREGQARADRSFTLLDLAQTLHESTTGTTDPLSPSERTEVRSVLQLALDTWTVGLPYAKAYDDAVRRLIGEALEESK